MRVTGEIAQRLLGPRERRLAIEHPLDAPQRGDEALESPLVGKSGMRVEERQPTGVVRIHEHRQHLAPEQARQHVDMHEEVGEVQYRNGKLRQKRADYLPPMR